MAKSKQHRVDFDLSTHDSPSRHPSAKPIVFPPSSKSIMVSRKEMPNGIVAVPAPAPAIPASSVPAPLQFPLLVLLSLTLSAFLYSFTSEFTAGDLSSVSRSINDWGEVVGLLAVKTMELAVGWWGEYDSYDLASLTLLSHLPPLYLLTTFYGIRPTTLLTSLAIDIITTYVPFRMLRPVLPPHSSEAPKGAVSNRSVINDWHVNLSTSLLAAGIYAIVVYVSLATWLPMHLVLHFDGLRDISGAYDASAALLNVAFVIPGFAAKSFLFTPATGAKADLGDIRASAFNPETATLGETVLHNLWGYSKRTRTMIIRTVTLATVVFLNTLLQVSVTIEGADVEGAAGWAAVWASAAVITGAAMWWVGDVEGVTN